MGRKLTYNFTGDCPHAGDHQTISINYLEVPLLGTLSSGWKKDTFRCPNSDCCPPSPYGDHRDCPLYLAAPDNPT